MTNVQLSTAQGSYRYSLRRVVKETLWPTVDRVGSPAPAVGHDVSIDRSVLPRV